MPRALCHGTRHVKGCRPGRPQCKLMRKVRPQRKPCYCDRYHYPHRTGSGCCGDIEKMWDRVYGPAWRDERDEQAAIRDESLLVVREPTDDEVPFLNAEGALSGPLASVLVQRSMYSSRQSSGSGP